MESLSNAVPSFLRQGWKELEGPDLLNVDLEDAGAEPTAPALHPARVLASHPGCAAGPERSKLEVPRAGAGNGRHPQGFKKLLQSGHSLHLVGGGSRQWQASAECQVLNLTDSCLAAVYLVFGSLIQGVLDVGGQDKVRSQTRSELPWPEQATPAEGESSRDEGPAPEESQHDAPSHSRKRAQSVSRRSWVFCSTPRP